MEEENALRVRFPDGVSEKWTACSGSTSGRFVLDLRRSSDSAR